MSYHIDLNGNLNGGIFRETLEKSMGFEVDTVPPKN